MGSSDTDKGIYKFDEFILDAGKRRVYDSQGEAVSLMPKAFDILLYLVSNEQRVVEKEELMDAIWPDTSVEENNLTQNISALRRALGEKHRENRFIATVPGRGYKFVAAVHKVDHEATSVGAGPGNVQPTSTRVRSRWLTFAGIALAGGLIITAVMLWRGTAGAPAGEIRSVAVLPFKPLSSQLRDESLELGMADALISKLGADDRVVIRPIGAVRRFNSLEQDPAEAGRVLGVDAVLDGNIQVAEGRMRVSVKLLRVTDSRQLWSGQFDEQLTGIFAVQDSIAQRVASALNIRLGRSAEKIPTENVEAYQLYMRGNFHARRLVRSEVEKGIAYYEEALRLDPRFALAYVDLANAYRALVLTSDYEPAEYMAKSKQAAQKALESDPALAEAWAATAIGDFWHDWNWPAAEANFLRALELDPHSSQTHLFYAHLLSNIGRHAEALEQVRLARERDPVSLHTNTIEGQILFFAGDTERAAAVLSRTIDMEPTYWLAHLFITRVHLKNGNHDQAIVSARRAAELSGGNAEAVGTVGYALAVSGRPEEARQIISELNARAKTRFVPAYSIAQIHAGLGDTESTIEYLEKAYAERDALMVFLKVEPKWHGLRGDRRFADLMRRMNLE